MANSKSTRFSQVTVRMEDIQRMHNDLRKLLERVGYVGGASFPVATGLTRELMVPLLELAPILVVANKRGQQEGSYQVVGGVRSYLLARHLMESDDEISVMKIEGKNSLDRMRERLVAECVAMPVMWQTAEGKDLVQRVKMIREVGSKLLENANHEDMAKLLGISSSKLKGMSSSKLKGMM